MHFPSPVVGEGGSHRGCETGKGSLTLVMLRPLIRHGLKSVPPSPTRGEGKKNETARRLLNALRPNYSRRGRRPAAAATAARRGTGRPASRAEPPAASPPLRCLALRRSIRHAPAIASAPTACARSAPLPSWSWRGG